MTTTTTPRNATPTALRYTRAEILQADADATGHDNPWSIIAAHLRNNWIRPGTSLAYVAGPGSGVIAPLAWEEYDNRADAVAQVRGNLIWYPSGWIVTSEGAERVFDLPEMTGWVCGSGYDGRRRRYGADILPFDALPAYRYGGPAKVTADGWAVSYTTGTDIDGTRLNLRRVNPDGTGAGKAGETHELDGRLYPTVDDAERAAYDAGATLFYVKESDRIMYGLH